MRDLGANTARALKVSVQNKRGGSIDSIARLIFEKLR